VLERRWPRWLPIAAVAGLVLLAAACGGEKKDGGDSGQNGDSVSGELEITAENTLFDKDELVEPVGQPLTVTYPNKDAGLLHDFDVYTLDEEGEPDELVFDGEIFEGIDTKTFTVPALEAGTYQFICSVHPATMVGALIVE